MHRRDVFQTRWNQEGDSFFLEVGGPGENATGEPLYLNINLRVRVAMLSNDQSMLFGIAAVKSAVHGLSVPVPEVPNVRSGGPLGPMLSRGSGALRCYSSSMGTVLPFSP